MPYMMFVMDRLSISNFGIGSQSCTSILAVSHRIGPVQFSTVSAVCSIEIFHSDWLLLCSSHISASQAWSTYTVLLARNLIIMGELTFAILQSVLVSTADVNTRIVNLMQSHNASVQWVRLIKIGISIIFVSVSELAYSASASSSHTCKSVPWLSL